MALMTQATQNRPPGPLSRRPVGRFLKRTSDVMTSALGLIVISPVMALVAFLVYVTVGRSVLFHWALPGLNGRPFTLCEFRTMTDAREPGDMPLSDDQRLTPLGKALGRWSPDEFPQLWNVLGGDMSLVRPRPLLIKYVPLYTQEQHRRHEVKPGIAGWTQVKGRNALTWEEKFELDVCYVEHWSLWLDTRSWR